jgi:hypothetical protein
VRVPRPLDATAATLYGVMLGQLPIAVLGVLLITGEYSTGSIRSSLPTTRVWASVSRTYCAP